MVIKGKISCDLFFFNPKKLSHNNTNNNIYHFELRADDGKCFRKLPTSLDSWLESQNCYKLRSLLKDTLKAAQQ